MFLQKSVDSVWVYESFIYTDTHALRFKLDNSESNDLFCFLVFVLVMIRHTSSKTGVRITEVDRIERTKLLCFSLLHRKHSLRCRWYKHSWKIGWRKSVQTGWPLVLLSSLPPLWLPCRFTHFRPDFLPPDAEDQSSGLRGSAQSKSGWRASLRTSGTPGDGAGPRFLPQLYLWPARCLNQHKVDYWWKPLPPFALSNQIFLWPQVL